MMYQSYSLGTVFALRHVLNRLQYVIKKSYNSYIIYTNRKLEDRKMNKYLKGCLIKMGVLFNIIAIFVACISYVTEFKAMSKLQKAILQNLDNFL